MTNLRTQFRYPWIFEEQLSPDCGRVSHGWPRQLRTGAEELPPQIRLTFPSGVLFSQVDAESKDDLDDRLPCRQNSSGDWCLAEHTADI